MLRCTWSYFKLIAKSQKRVFQNLGMNSSLVSSICRRESEAFRSASSLYMQCLRKNSKLYISTASSYAKTKYKMQNLYDRLVNGKREKAAAQVAFMITQDMKQSLADLGFNVKLVATMKPAIAQYIINHDISYSKWMADNASILQAYEKEEADRRARAEEEARIAAEEARKELEALKLKEGGEASGEQTAESDASVDSSVCGGQAGGLVLVREEETNLDELDASKSAGSSSSAASKSASPSLMVVEEGKKDDSF